MLHHFVEAPAKIERDGLPFSSLRQPAPPTDRQQRYNLSALHQVVEVSNSPPAGEQLDHEEDNCNHKDEMNQAACDVKTESKEPKDDKDYYEGIEHIACGCSLFAIRDGYACKTFRECCREPAYSLTTRSLARLLRERPPRQTRYHVLRPSSRPTTLAPPVPNTRSDGRVASANTFRLSMCRPRLHDTESKARESIS